MKCTPPNNGEYPMPIDEFCTTAVESIQVSAHANDMLLYMLLIIVLLAFLVSLYIATKKR